MDTHVLFLKSNEESNTALIPFANYNDAKKAYIELPEADPLKRVETQEYSVIKELDDLYLEELMLLNDNMSSYTHLSVQERFEISVELGVILKEIAE